MTGSPRILARGDGVDGEIALRQRGPDGVDVYELIVNGVFLMDTVETSTERLLAEAVRMPVYLATRTSPPGSPEMMTL